jgi:hypothetical protein
MNKQQERVRREQLTGKFFAPPQRIPYLWVNHLFPVALVISLGVLIWNS